MPAGSGRAGPNSRHSSSSPSGRRPVSTGSRQPRQGTSAPALRVSFPPQYPKEYNEGLKSRSRPKGLDYDRGSLRPWIARPPWSPLEIALQCREILGNGLSRRTLHGAIPSNHGRAELGERCGSAAGAACRGTDERLPELRVHAVDQQPRRTIGHAHFAGGAADRSAVADRLQDLDLSWTQRTIRAQVAAQEHSRHQPYVTH